MDFSFNRRISKIIKCFIVMVLMGLSVVNAQNKTNNTNKNNDSAILLAQMLQKSSTLVGNFSQLTLDGTGAKLQEMSGSMQLKRPHKFRWQILEPIEQLMLSNGDKLWIYDPDLEQVTVQKLDERFMHTPGVLLSGDSQQISNNFEVTHSTSGSIIDFILKPKVENPLFVSLRISMRDNVLNDIQMIDSVGQRTNIIFFALKENEKLADADFEFIVPVGVDVVEQ